MNLNIQNAPFKNVFAAGLEPTTTKCKIANRCVQRGIPIYISELGSKSAHSNLGMLLPIQPVLEDRFFITQGVEHLPRSGQFRFFEPSDSSIAYSAFCDDFGPLNMSCVAHFVSELEDELHNYPDSCIFYNTEENPRSLTNGLFLVGAYMIMKLDKSLEEINDILSFIDEDLTESYRDATYNEAGFKLSLQDCWRGLLRGKLQGWITHGVNFEDSWGMINIEEYAHYDNPLNGDMHEVVPGKFIAFKGPHDIGGLTYLDDELGRRSFSPSFYADVFQDFEVRHVIRLNENGYDQRGFEDFGISHHILEFEDCTIPPPELVDAFFSIVDRATGVVAVHCKAGLGRTGTLIALYLMRTYGFSAREAMGWLRIMRPGSVIGQQQHYLCDVESAGGDYWATSVLYDGSTWSELARNAAEQLSAGVEKRNSARSLMMMDARLSDSVVHIDASATSPR